MSAPSFSIFYQHKYGRKFPVSLLCLEVYSSKMKDSVTDDEIYNTLVTVLSSTCGVTNPTNEDLEYFMSRLKQIDEDMRGDGKEGAQGRVGKSFGTSFSEYLQSLSLDSAILKMTGYDMEAATRLFCDIDRDDVIKLVGEYYSGKAEENLVAMEASMYGGGNSYKEDKPGKRASKANTHDLTTPEGMQAIKSMGF